MGTMNPSNPYAESNYRQIGRISYEIKNRFLDKRYHAVYSKTKNEIYYGCSKNCEMCKLWSKKHNTWKTSYFFPIHCHICEEAGMPDDFVIRDILIFCEKCYQKIIFTCKNLLNREIGKNINNNINV